MKKWYDCTVVGAGLFGSTIAYELSKLGKRVLVLDRRKHIGGNCYTESMDGINVHLYGALIFRTSSKKIWLYINRFAEFNHFVNSPLAVYRGKCYNLPFNMNTFYQMWGCKTPSEAKKIIEKQRDEITGIPRNLEEQAISLVGRDIYEILIREYTEKQWGRPCNELPASILRRLPIRFTYDNNYFRDPFQGIPIGGYTQIFKKMLSNCEVRTGVDFLKSRDELMRISEKVVFTGAIDEFFDYSLGSLDYRSLRFEHKRLTDTDNLQGVAVVNYTDRQTPYTRSIEHKHFEFGQQPTTVVSYEYSSEWSVGIEPYYPINDEKNHELLGRYRNLASTLGNVVFGGRLGSYKYTDMQDTIADALAAIETIV